MSDLPTPAEVAELFADLAKRTSAISELQASALSHIMAGRMEIARVEMQCAAELAGEHAAMLAGIAELIGEQDAKPTGPEPVVMSADPAPASVSREEFHANPNEAVARAIRDGRVVIRDDQGRAVAAIGAPMDRRPVPDD